MAKKITPKTAEDYRPITLTSVVCKVMEKVVKQQLEQFLLQTSQLNPAQHGFTKGKSCTTNLLLAREHWAQAVDSGKSIDVIYIDFSKAFDRVPHKRLLTKLNALGIREKLLKWIESFISGRSNQVNVNGSLSYSFQAESGVPQGSVLGPLLFKIFVNDLPDHLATQSLMFADDLKVWTAISSSSDVTILQTALNDLAMWSVKWLLPINHSKSAVLHIGKENPHFSYSVDGQRIQAIAKERDLGTIVSADLKTKNDSIRKAGAANRLWWALRRSFSVITPEIFRFLFPVFIRPILEYGLPVTYPQTKGEAVDLEKVQRRATKSVQGMHQLSYQQRLTSLNLFPLSYRRDRFDLLFCRRIVRGELGTEIKSFFEIDPHPRTRGHGYKLKKRRTQKNKTNFTLSTRVTNSWNRLPTDAVYSNSECQFKNILDSSVSANGICCNKPGCNCHNI